MSSVKEMQIFLSINGLELNESHGFDESDLETLSRWISLAQLPVKMDGKSLRPENSLTMLCNVPILDSNQAWSVLSTYFKCEKTVDGTFFVPSVGRDPFSLTNEEDEVSYYNSIEELRASIRCYGLKYAKPEDQTLVSIFLWASLSKVDPFVIVPLETDGQGKGAVERSESQCDGGNTEKIDNKNTSNVEKKNDANVSNIIPETINKSKKTG